MSDIFISYKRDDRAKVKALAEALEATGRSVWWDSRLRGGERFTDVIEAELRSARCVIVAWSKRSVESRFVKDEASYALNLGKLIPVRIEDVTPPFRFDGLHTRSLVDWDGSGESPAFRELLGDIDGLAGSSPTSVTADAEDERNGRTLPPSPPSSSTSAGPDASSDDESDVLSMLRTTATYGEGFKATETADEYVLKVYVGGLAGPKTADARARKESEEFMRAEGYVSYEIAGRRYKLLPSSFEYTVRFKRGSGAE